MSQIIVIRPVEANFNDGMYSNMNPYCKFRLGKHTAKSSVAKGQGMHPYWNDALTLNRKHDELFLKLAIKSKDHLYRHKLGKAKIVIDEVLKRGGGPQWFIVYHKRRVIGQALIQIEAVLYE